MSDLDELGRTLRTLLLEEAAAMKIDTSRASERLESELQAAPRRRPLVIAAAVAAAALVVAALLLRPGGDDAGDSVPVDEPDPASEAADPAAEVPNFFLDLPSLDRADVPAVVVRNQTAGPFFSPDGTRFAYTICGDPTWASCAPTDELYIGNVDGTGIRRLPRIEDGLNAYPLAWTPDGTGLVVQVRHGGTIEVGKLFLYDLDTGEATQVTDPPVDETSWWVIGATVSPDGQQVLYDLARLGVAEQGFDVWSAPVSGGKSTLLFRNATAPAGLADGRVAFLRDGFRILAADPGDQPQPLTEADISDFAVSPDGTRIVYVDGGVRADLYLLDVATGEAGEPLLEDVAGAYWVGNDRLLIEPGS